MSALFRGIKWLLAAYVVLFVLLNLAGSLTERPTVLPDTATADHAGVTSPERQPWQDPLETVKEYFEVLAGTGYTTYFGSIGNKEDYLAAYELLSHMHQAELPFDQFYESFKGVASIELLQLVLVPGGEEDRRRVFVEFKALEEVAPGSLSSDLGRAAFIYYAGFVTVIKVGTAWKIDQVELNAEDFISPLGGHQPWRWDPQAIAAIAAEEELKAIGITDSWAYPSTFEELENGLTRISFTAERGTVSVLLAQLTSGEWLALRVEREGVECTATVQPGESIQAMIDGAEEGNVICLAEGMWEENLKIQKSLTLRGTGQEETIIKGKEEGYPVIWIMTPEDTSQTFSIKVEALMITEAHGSCVEALEKICSFGILIQGSAQVGIADSTISQNEDSGIWIMDSAKAEITNSTISENDWRTVGMWLQDSAQAEITDSTISENGGGIYIRGSAQATVTRSTISENANHGIVVQFSARAEIADCSISENGGDGITLCDSAQAIITGSTVSGNSNGIELKDSAQAAIVKNTIVYNHGYNVGYGITLWQRPCYNTDDVFTGHVSGKRNNIPGPGEPGANCGNPVCPMPELEFLMTEEGGWYP